VSAKTYRSTLHLELGEMLAGLNQMLRAWASYFRHAVAKRVFSLIDEHAWRRLVGWIYRKHSRISWKQLRRRFCLPGSWTIASKGRMLTGASSVAVTRYRYRGSTIPTPWTPTPAATG
jgi:RNA-directed DNA polymerase